MHTQRVRKRAPHSRPPAAAFAARADGKKAGVDAAGAAGSAASRARGRVMSLEEAQMVLGVEPNTTWDAVLKARAATPRDTHARAGSAHAGLCAPR
jgi:hypothetical protein